MSVAPAYSLDPNVVARLAGLELRARYIIDGYLHGQHRSPYRGQSVEFAEHREYAAGDDLRYVDWKVFGKTDRVYLKQFEAETTLSCYLAVDVSESMSYQGPASPLSKFAYAQCVAAALAHLVLRQRDHVGFATLAAEVREFAPAAGDPARFEQLVRVLDQSGPHGTSDLGVALGQLADRLPRRSVVVIISDLLGKIDGLSRGLQRLRHARHELLVLHTLDAAELDFPFQREMLFHGLEGLPSVLAHPHGVRRAYLSAVARFLEQVHSVCRHCRADYELALTDRPFDVPLRRILTARRRRRG